MIKASTSDGRHLFYSTPKNQRYFDTDIDEISSEGGTTSDDDVRDSEVLCDDEIYVIESEPGGISVRKREGLRQSRRNEERDTVEKLRLKRVVCLYLSLPCKSPSSISMVLKKVRVEFLPKELYNFYEVSSPLPLWIDSVVAATSLEMNGRPPSAISHTKTNGHSVHMNGGQQKLSQQELVVNYDIDDPQIPSSYYCCKKLAVQKLCRFVAVMSFLAVTVNVILYLLGFSRLGLNGYLEAIWSVGLIILFTLCIWQIIKGNGELPRNIMLNLNSFKPTDEQIEYRPRAIRQHDNNRAAIIVTSVVMCLLGFVIFIDCLFLHIMRIGFIGAGKMAQAMARGLINSGRINAENIIASSPKNDYSLLDQCKQLGLQTTHENTEVVHKSDVVFVAVKPVHVNKVASEIAPHFSREQLLISIALGITIRNIESLLPAKSRVVRVMPNTPAVVRAGASAFSVGSACRDGDSEIVRDLLSTVGFAVEVPEYLIDPVTGLSGSGPSYMFAAIEGLADGGVKVGLPRDLAIKLAAHTLFGAARMVLETGIHPAQLKDDVQSPAGSSVYAMHKLESSGFKGILMDAVEAATNRSRQTGDKSLPRDMRNTEM
ncbi:hypothetical protein WR25_16194 isoform B [Diploscapter pachys]|nr:hypothetical protein WR25_16194 isoform B [Diploscapter pachys]